MMRLTKHIEFTETMSDDEKKDIFTKRNLASGVTDKEAVKKAEADLSEYKAIMEIIDNPANCASTIRIKDDKIIEKTGKFADVSDLERLKERICER